MTLNLERARAGDVIVGVTCIEVELEVIVLNEMREKRQGAPGKGTEKGDKQECGVTEA